ncbi:hypothetical protein [Azospirillum rugosum]|uniref:Uncharacterized protein n=1 Tax=Azospirillum rugosum TaxID=416170 RepID=A0ABS4SX16_9PROT|nr:hypothetical protein [Azospirillum rugosum]MBP2297108.1 hypothetical protein [Azospirillum rugosum]MDQ0530926.1 hypothetical protein [Azospirillum rugosum]
MIQIKASVALLIIAGSIVGSAVITHIVTRYSLNVICAAVAPAEPARTLPVGPMLNSRDGEAF